MMESRTGHQSAVHRAASTRQASPRSHRSPFSTPRHRRSIPAACSHRFRRRLGQPAPAGSATGRPEQRSALAYQQIQSGDTTCAANQALHGERPTSARRSPPTRITTAGRRDALDPSRSSTRSTCRCSWPANGRTSRRRHCPSSCGTHRDEPEWFTFTTARTSTPRGGTPATYNRWYDFLELFVAPPGADR